MLCVEKGRWRKGDGRGLSLTVYALQCIEEFCYLEDMIGSGGGDGSSSLARVRSGLKKFIELLPHLMLRCFSLLS